MTGRDRQTLADISLMASGSGEAMFGLSRKNNIPLDASSDIISGQEIVSIEIIDKRVVDYYERNKIVPANEPNE